MVKRTYKIKAFTLTEVIVVMAISAIVVGLTFTILGIVQHNLRSIENNYAYHTKLQSLEVSLTIDFNRYNQAIWDSKNERLILSSPIGNNIYSFYSDSIVTNKDSYLVKIKTKTLYFEGKPVDSGSIDAIKITFDNTKNSHRVFVYKHNDPSIHF